MLDLVKYTGNVKTLLMGQMMELAVADTMMFGVAEDEELHSPYADVSTSDFNRKEQTHLQEFVGGLTADTREQQL